MEGFKCKKLHEDAILPKYGSKKAAGADLYAYLNESYVDIQPHSTMMIGTGLSFQLRSGFAGFIFARSGLATKKGLRPANCVGVCDSDYTGEYIVALHNDTDVVQRVYNGDRIAQLIVMPVCQVAFDLVEELDETERGSGGFGSTGTN